MAQTGRLIGRLAVVAAAAALAGAALVLAAAAPARAGVFNPTTFTLDNGLQVVVVENHRAPIVTHMVWYKVGSADETPGKSGLAHFLEHLMFKGTHTLKPGDFSKIVARIGGRENAFTSQDYTSFYQSVAADQLETVMRIEADRMANLVLTDAVVDPERQVVLEERRARTDNQPASLLSEQVQAALYVNHPYRLPIVGWEHEIKHLSTEDALAFYHRHYAPNNAVLIVAGDITAERLRPLAEKYYGVIPAGDMPARVRPQEPEQHAPRFVVLHDERVGQPSWRRYYLAPSYTSGASEHAYPLQLLSEIVGGGSTSRLYRSLVVEQKIAVDAGAWYQASSLDLTTFGFYAVPRPGRELDEVERAVDAEIAKILAEGVSEDELERAKQRMRAAAVYARDDTSTGARIIGMALTTGRTIEDVEAWPERLEVVTTDQVLAAARAVLVEKNSVTSQLLPKRTPSN